MRWWSNSRCSHQNVLSLTGLHSPLQISAEHRHSNNDVPTLPIRIILRPFQSFTVHSFLMWRTDENILVEEELERRAVRGKWKGIEQQILIIILCDIFFWDDSFDSQHCHQKRGQAILVFVYASYMLMLLLSSVLISFVRYFTYLF